MPQTFDIEIETIMAITTANPADRRAARSNIEPVTAITMADPPIRL